MTLEWLTGWWNLVFVLPFGLALLYLALYTLSGWTFGEPDAEVGVDFDADADVDVHADVDLDGDVSHDVHAAVDADGGVEADSEGNAGHPSAFLSALNWIGVGRVPLSLVLMIMMMCWGVVGFAAMQVERGSPIVRSTLIAAAIAALVSVLITHTISSILGPLLYRSVPISRRWHELLGSRGEALYPIDARFGMVAGRDDRCALFQAACRIQEGQLPLAKGDAVRLVGYAAKERMFYVVPVEGAKAPARHASEK